MMTMQSNLTEEQRRTLLHVEREKGHDYAGILVAIELIAEKLSQLPQSVVDAKIRELAAGVRTNGYAGTCRDCGNTVPAGEGGLVKANGSWVSYHIDGCPAPAPQAAPVAADEPKPARTNGYAQDCITCKVSVPAGQGELFKSGGRWAVRHFPTCPEVESTEAPFRIEEDGFFFNSEGDVFKVQRSMNGRLYAKKLMGDGTWKYEGAKPLSDSTMEPLTLGKAQELGHLYGVCVRCGRTLTDEQSIADGIGPICKGKFQP